MTPPRNTRSAEDIFNALNTPTTANTPTTTATAKMAEVQKRPIGRPTKTPEEKKGGYKFNLNMDKDLKTYLKNKAWQDRKSASDYINELIRKDMEQYFANGGTTEGWINEE